MAHEFVNVTDGKQTKSWSLDISSLLTDGVIVDDGDYQNNLVSSLSLVKRRFEAVPILEITDSVGFGIGAVITPILKNIEGDSGVVDERFEVIGLKIEDGGRLYDTPILHAYDYDTTPLNLSGAQSGEWKNYKEINVSGDITVDAFSETDPDGGKIKIQARIINVNNNIDASDTGWTDPLATNLTHVPIDILEYYSRWPTEKPATWTWVNGGTAEPSFEDFDSVNTAWTDPSYYEVNGIRINPNNYKVIRDINPNIMKDYEWPASIPGNWTWQGTGASQSTYAGAASAWPSEFWRVDEAPTVGGVSRVYMTIDEDDWTSSKITWVDNGASKPTSPGGNQYYISDIVHANERGTHSGANNATILTDSNKAWVVNALVGETIYNITDGCSGTITANTATTITTSGGLSGGTDDDWDTNDEYIIDIVNTTFSGYAFINVDENVPIYNTAEYFPDDSNEFFPQVPGFERECFTLNYTDVAQDTGNLQYIYFAKDYNRWFQTQELQMEYRLELTDTLTGDGAKFRYVEDINNHPVYVNEEQWYMYYDTTEYKIMYINGGSPLEMATSDPINTSMDMHVFKINPTNYTGAMWPSSIPASWTWVGGAAQPTLLGAQGVWPGQYWEVYPERTVEGASANTWMNDLFVDLNDLDYESIDHTTSFSNRYPHYLTYNFNTAGGAPTSIDNFIREWNVRNDGYNDTTGYLDVDNDNFYNNRIFRLNEMNSLMGAGGTQPGGGHVTLQAEEINIADTKSIDVSTTGDGSGGTICLMTRGTLSILDSTDINDAFNISSTSGEDGLIKIFCHESESPVLTKRNIIFDTITTDTTFNATDLYGTIHWITPRKLSDTPIAGTDYGDYKSLGDPRSEYFIYAVWRDSVAAYSHLRPKQARSAIQLLSDSYLILASQLKPSAIEDETKWRITTDTTGDRVSMFTKGHVLNGGGSLTFGEVEDASVPPNSFRTIFEFDYNNDWDSLKTVAVDNRYETTTITIYKIQDVADFKNDVYNPIDLPIIPEPDFTNSKYQKDVISEPVYFEEEDRVTIRIQQIPSDANGIYRIGEHLLTTLRVEEL